VGDHDSFIQDCADFECLVTHTIDNFFGHLLKLHSFKHIIALLHTSDVEVLDSTLQLMIRQAQRVSLRRGAKHSPLSPAQEQVLILAQSWGPMEQDMPDVSAAMETSDNGALHFPAEESVSFTYQFYKKPSKEAVPPPAVAPAAGVSAAVPSTPISSTSAGIQSTPAAPTPMSALLSSTPSINATTPSATPVKQIVSFSPFTTPVSQSISKSEKPSDAVTQINIPDVFKVGANAEEVMKWISNQYDVPDEHLFAIFHRLRISMGIRDPASRQELLVIRVFALAVACEYIKSWGKLSWELKLTTVYSICSGFCE
jgi:hypothetical protein